VSAARDHANYFLYTDLDIPAISLISVIMMGSLQDLARLILHSLTIMLREASLK